MEALLFQCLAIFMGASVGSFLNVVVYRLPANLSLLFPPSRCPHCLKKLAPRDNIPVLGWFLIKGKCRYCHSPVSFRYPLVEAITAALFWAVAVVFGGSTTWQIQVFYWAFLSWLLVLALIDIDTMTLPNALTQSGLVVGLGYQGAIAVMAESNPLQIPIAHFLLLGITGAVLGLWLLDLMRFSGGFLLGVEAMGEGDAKLAAMMGAWLGWEKLLLAILVAASLGAVIGLGAIAVKRLGRRQAFPFGPFLALGGAFALFSGDTVLKIYLAWFGWT